MALPNEILLAADPGKKATEHSRWAKSVDENLTFLKLSTRLT